MLPHCAVDRGLHERTADAAASDRLGDAGVHQDEAVGAPAVDELGGESVLLEDEPLPVSFVGDLDALKIPRRNGPSTRCRMSVVGAGARWLRAKVRENPKEVRCVLTTTSSAWPALPYTEWRDTLDTLHMFTQIVGKVRLALAPDEPQWGQVPLYLTARGLSTSAMPWADGTIDIEFDLVGHELVIRASHGLVKRIPLTDRSVADFYREVMADLDQLGVNVSIYETPVEFADPIPFPDDDTHKTYDPGAVARYFDALGRVAAVMHEYRGRFRGRTSPVHFFWGTFDLANTRYSGAPAEPPPVADPITRASYNVEQISVGFWPGDERIAEAAFFAYGYPKPDQIAEAAIDPGPAFWSEENGLFLLRYDDMRGEPDPLAAIRQFFDSSYQACASRLGWSPSLAV
jgi:Family of unknown function (DUF5996)